MGADQESPAARALAAARAQLRAGDYFEAHETLEAAWMTAEGDLKTALQGLVQVCAGLHKLASGGENGARYLLGRGLAKLLKCGAALPPGAADPFEAAARAGMARLSEGA